MTDDKYTSYEKAVRQVWLDGQVSIDEADMIEALRKSLNITLEEHAEIERKIRKEYEKARAEGGTLSTEPTGDIIDTSGDTPEETPEATPEPTSAETDDGEAIGDLSGDELSKDLESLSKSIGELGVKIFGNDSDAKPASESSKASSVSEIEIPSFPEDKGAEPPTPEVTDDAPTNDGSTVGSDLLDKLKTDYSIEDTPLESESSPDTGGDEGAPAEPPFPSASPDIEAVEGDMPLEPEEPAEEVTAVEYLDAGKEAFRAKDYKDAVRLLKKALKIDPENKEVKFFLRKVVKAVKELKAKRAKEPEESPAAEDTDAVSEPEPEPEPAREEPAANDAVEAASDMPEPGPEKAVEAPVVEGSGDPNCSSCGGSGVCTWCKGASKCYWCNATGKCTKCDGTKEIDGQPCSFCNAEGTCGSCEGTGSCTWCKGSGRCNSCNPG